MIKSKLYHNELFFPTEIRFSILSFQSGQCGKVFSRDPAADLERSSIYPAIRAITAMQQSVRSDNFK